MKVKINGNDWYEVTSDFGNKDPIHSGDFHKGVDFAMPEGTELFSPIDGVIKNVVDFGDRNIGKGIYLETKDGETMILGHLSDSLVEIGQKVNTGDLIALSGNTGNSTGPHLHISLRDSDGYFIDPKKVIIESDFNMNDFNINDLLDLVPENQKGIALKMIERGDDFKISPDGSEIIEYGIGNSSFIDDVRSFSKFINGVKDDGLFETLYEKSFFEVVKDFFKQFFIDVGTFILENADLFFLMPAIAFMVATFLIGNNKFTKYIIPLWLLYFVSTFFHKMIIFA